MLASSDILQSKLLIVDNEPSDVRLLESVLRGAGYGAVTSTMDSRLVVDLHRKNRYDLILLDLLMPDPNGYAVLEGLKETENSDSLFVLVMTSFLAEKERALLAGARDFIGKPLNVADLLTRVHSLLEQRGLHRRDKDQRRRVLGT